MHFIYNIAFILAAYRWGDWQNWQRYYPTILFFILMDVIEDFLTYNHPLWLFHHAFIQDHTVIALLNMLMRYPAIVLIFLKYFYQTNNIRKRAFHFILWILIYATIEYINLSIGITTHHNGWNMWYSLLFYIAMFATLVIHYKKPLIAWTLSFVFLLLICFKFDFWQYMK
ncbi:MAG: CBO0543 family protein [Bacillota bacterium]